MSLQFENAKAESQFDHYAEAWIKKYRCPDAADLAAIMQRAHDNLAGALPSVSAFERAYRELYAEGEVQLVTARFIEQTVAQPEVLTAEEYHRIPAAESARRYKTSPGFKASVDALIARKLI
jgi:hypothetical protein